MGRANSIMGAQRLAWVFAAVIALSSANRAPTNVSYAYNSRVPHDGDPATDYVTVTLRPRSLDPDGDPISHVWECPSSGADTAKTRSHLASFTATFRAGVHSCSLVASDPFGASTSGAITLTVQSEMNQQPIAHAGYNTNWTIPHDESPLTSLAAVTLDATNSTDIDGDKLWFRWQCGATQLDLNRFLEHIQRSAYHHACTDNHRKESCVPDYSNSVVVAYLAAGVHTCVVTVRDPYDATSSSSVIVKVFEEPNDTPVANAGSDQSYTVPHDFYPTDETDLVRVTLDGTLTADADGDRMTHDWRCGAVAAVSARAPSNATVHLSVVEQLGAGGDLFIDAFTHDRNEVDVMLPEGTYGCVLTTTDTYGAVSTDTVQVVVNAEPNGAPDAA